MRRPGALSLDFRADSFDHPSGLVDAGTVIGWIDKVAYAVAASWSGMHVRARYMGNMQFRRPIPVDTRVTVQGRVVRTHAAAVHVQTRLLLPEILDDDGRPVVSTSSICVYAAEEDGVPQDVPEWIPSTPGQIERNDQARTSSIERRAVEKAMARLPFPDPEPGHDEMVSLAFIAPITEASVGGTVRGGAVMRWLDEAAGVCAARWTGHENVAAVFAGGVRFVRPVQVGDLVRVDALLVNTSERSMHVALRVHAGPRHRKDHRLVAHSISVMVDVTTSGQAGAVPQYTPESDAARRLQESSVELVRLRTEVGSAWSTPEPRVPKAPEARGAVDPTAP
ncbi:acyl-CoA hydrolase [Micrococcus flavus]|uniref:Acyl-CoA hydrolase n=1 Tax=Micrococcus flavus TaxID=384602 RepID=A0A4Y8WVB6_9MICC|nr:hotdog domain-containing protein [Micrococcus flavus]MBB4881690.1 acyl-CoA hydrolase [Micrococcus flavus]TFH98729.1 acyl-CoA hydrolase [Micrococcus flavus]GGK54097.1 acyl-CoA thioesterase [Micrococcus flavus]